MSVTASMTGRAEITTVNMGPFMRDEGVVLGDAPTKAQQVTAAAIDAACRDHGFVQVINFGLTPALSLKAFDVASELFALPEAHKKSRLKRITPETNTGYAPRGHERLNRSRPADLKEAYNVGWPRLERNDFGGTPETFEATAGALWSVLELAARRYALACAVALGVEADFFSRALVRFDLCTLRMLHYPPCDAPTPEHGDPAITPLRVGEHTDFGAFTFLLLGAGAEGLQMKSVSGAEVGGQAGGEADGWLDVVPQPQPEGVCGALVNTGALLARWTNDTWRATAHRVVVPSASIATRHRYSIACFIDPDADAEVAVDPRFVTPGQVLRYPPTTGGEFLLAKLKEAQGLV